VKGGEAGETRSNPGGGLFWLTARDAFTGSVSPCMSARSCLDRARAARHRGFHRNESTVIETNRSAITSATTSAVAPRIPRDLVRSAPRDHRPEARANALDPLFSKPLEPSVQCEHTPTAGVHKEAACMPRPTEERPWGRPPHLGVISSRKTSITSNEACREG